MWVFLPVFIASFKDKRAEAGFGPFLVATCLRYVRSLDAVCKLAVLFLPWAGRRGAEAVCYC